jgi:hypothetical protein
MKRVLAVAFAAAACTAFGSTPALAGSGPGNACPPPSHNPNGSPPCGNQGNNGHKKCPPQSKNPGGVVPCGIDHHGSVDITCPPKSKNPGGNPPCGIDHHDGGGGGGGGGGTTPPPGNCTKADVVLLSADAKIVCLYFGANAPNATSDCPDGLVRLAVDQAVGACVFLPPESN